MFSCCGIRCVSAKTVSISTFMLRKRQLVGVPSAAVTGFSVVGMSSRPCLFYGPLQRVPVRNQPPRRKLGTIPGTDARIGRSTIYTNRVWSMATRRRSPTKCVTATVGKSQLLDQVTAGFPHRDALQWSIKKTKGREEIPTTEKPVTAVECTPNSFRFCNMKVPIEVFSH